MPLAANTLAVGRVRAALLPAEGKGEGEAATPTRKHPRASAHLPTHTLAAITTAK